MMSPEEIAAITAQFELLEADAKLAHELASQSAPKFQPKKETEKEIKINSDKQPAHENDDIATLMAQFARIEEDEKFARELAALGKDKKIASESLDQDADFALALQTQFQLEKNRSKSLQHDTKENADQDAVLAAALQEMENEGAASLSDEMLAIHTQIPKRWEGKTTEERKKIEESLKAILVSPAVAGEQGITDLTNAHKFTSTLIREGIPVLTNIDDQFKLSSTELTPDQVLKEVLEFLEKMKKEGVDSRISIENIQKTFGHIRSNAAVDASETQANAHHLLSRTWTLAKTMGRDGMTEVVSLLSDNIGDGGACIPGLIARLYSPYAKMLAVQLGVEVSARRPIVKAK